MPEEQTQQQTGQILNTDSFLALRKAIVDYFAASIQELLPRIIVTLVILIVVILLRFLLLRLANRRVRNQSSRLRWRTNSTYFAILAFLVLAFPVWLPSLRSIATVLGIFGAGILIVFKEVFLKGFLRISVVEINGQVQCF